MSMCHTVLGMGDEVGTRELRWQLKVWTLPPGTRTAG